MLYQEKSGNPGEDNSNNSVTYHDFDVDVKKRE
jgi:hypothetical protein